MRFRRLFVPAAAAAALVFAAAFSVSADTQTPAGNVARGKLMFANANPKCSLCHDIGPSTVAKLGPNLAGVGTRRTAAWMQKFLPDPRAMSPESKMPPVGYKGQQLQDLIAYLQSLKGK